MIKRLFNTLIVVLCVLWSGSAWASNWQEVFTDNELTISIDLETIIIKHDDKNNAMVVFCWIKAQEKKRYFLEQHWYRHSPNYPTLYEIKVEASAAYRNNGKLISARNPQMITSGWIVPPPDSVASEVAHEIIELAEERLLKTK